MFYPFFDIGNMRDEVRRTGYGGQKSNATARRQSGICFATSHPLQMTWTYLDLAVATVLASKTDVFASVRRHMKQTS